MPRLRPALAVSARTPSQHPSFPLEKLYLTVQLAFLRLPCPATPAAATHRPAGELRERGEEVTAAAPAGTCCSAPMRRKKAGFLFPASLTLSASSIIYVIRSRLANKWLGRGWISLW